MGSQYSLHRGEWEKKVFCPHVPLPSSFFFYHVREAGALKRFRDGLEELFKASFVCVMDLAMASI